MLSQICALLSCVLDRHCPSLKAIVENDQITNDSELKVIAYKHASSTSLVHQMTDIGRQFAIFKNACKTTTAINLPSGFRLKVEIEYQLDFFSADGKLNLKLPARKHR